MPNLKIVKLWVEQNKPLLYLISFVSFWIVLSFQTQIKAMLTDRISQDMLNFATIAVMWGLAIYILPLIGAIIALTIYLRSRR